MQKKIAFLFCLTISSTAGEFDDLSTLLTKLNDKLKQLRDVVIKVFHSPRPLQNLGNTCYMNSVIQGLYATMPLTELLISNEKYYAADTLAHKYIQLIQALAVGKYDDQLKSFAKKTDNVMQASQILACGPGAQHDAQEFFLTLLTDLTSSTDSNLNSALKQMITTQYQFFIKCADRAIASKSESTTMLILPVRDPQMGQLLPGKLLEIIKAYFGSEPLEYKPDGTAELQHCSRKAYITALPAILIVNLARFDFDPILAAQNYALKVEAPLEFDMKDMIGDSLIDPSLVPPFPFASKYRLTATLVHWGGTAGGHYVAYVNMVDKWYLCNDSSISQVPVTDVVKSSEQAYIYIYQLL